MTHHSGFSGKPASFKEAAKRKRNGKCSGGPVLPEDEQNLLDLYRVLDSNDRTALRVFINFMSERRQSLNDRRGK